MFDSLHQFYTSAAWRSLRMQLLHERTLKNGTLLSDYSGKPIIRTYDIVLHHKIPLTLENVNDFNISLNAENIMIVTQKEHNEIHARFGYTTQRKVYYVYGPPCSGKTTFVKNIKGNSDLIVDIDNIWQCVTGGKRYDKPDALKSIVFSLMGNLREMVQRRVGKWERAYIIDGGALSSDRKRWINFFGAEPIYIDTDKNTCLLRLKADAERTEAQKAEWKNYIEKWFEDYTE